MSKPKEIGRELLTSGKFLKFENITWQGKDGKQGQWETMERRHGAEAVLIVPWIVETSELIIIKQYRPPAKDYVYELPAGLIDEGEEVEAAAIRELREETGYIGTMVGLLQPMYNTPGMSGEAVYCAYMDVACNQQPHKDLQDSEDIEVVLVKRGDIESFLRKGVENKDQFDSKLLMYLYGIVTEIKFSSVGEKFIREVPIIKN